MPTHENASLTPKHLMPLAFEGLSYGIAVLSLCLCFYGRGRAFLWVLLALALPASRCALDVGYRQRLLGWCSHLWQSVGTFAQHGGSLPWRATAVFVVLPAVFLFLSSSRTIGSGDTWPVIPTAISLVARGKCNLDESIATAPASYRASPDSNPYCTLQTAQGIYSRYPAGMVPFATPVVLVSRLLGADLDNPIVQGRLEKWTAVWLAASSLGLFFLLALHLADPRAAWVATLFLAVGSVIFSTVGQGLWQHSGVIFWSMVILLIEFRTTGRFSWPGTLGQGVACAMMLACRLSCVVFIVPFGCWVLLRSPRRAIAVAMSAGLAYVPWAVLHWSIYSNLCGPSAEQLDAGNWTPQLTEALLGLLVSPARGLFIYQPWVVIGMLALALGPSLALRAVTGKAPSGWRWFCAAAIGCQLLLVASWRCWWGGHCWGSRLIAETIPLFALLSVWPIAVLLRNRIGTAILVVLAILSFASHAAGVYDMPNWEHHIDLDHHPEMVWSWTRAPFVIRWHH